MTIDSGAGAKLIGVAATIGGLLLALYLGYLVGHQNTTYLAIIGVFVVCLIYLFQVKQHTIPVIIFLVSLDMMYSPGFGITSGELSAGFALGAVATAWWRAEKTTAMPYQGLFSYRVFCFLVIVWIFYAASHLIFNMWQPAYEGGFGFKGASKTYVAMMSPFLIVLLFLNRPYHLRVGPNISRTIQRLVLLAILLNIAFRIYTMVRLGGAAKLDDLAGTGMQQESAPLIPFINARVSPYALRLLGPLAVLVGGIFYSTREKFGSRNLARALIFFGMMGAIMSAGRAAFALSVCFLALAFVRSGKGALVLIGAIAGVMLTMIVVLLPSDAFQTLPFHVQRSVVMLRPWDKDQLDAGASVEGSGDWRKNLFNEAIREWYSTPRSFWFGRSAGTLTNDDVIDWSRDPEAALININIKRLSTHNGISDLLVGFGLIGLILNYLIYVALLVFLRGWLKILPQSSEVRPWISICFWGTAVYIVFTSFGGTSYWPFLTWLIVLGAMIARRDQRDADPPTTVQPHQPNVSRRRGMS